jgi:hypothetical protein
MNILTGGCEPCFNTMIRIEFDLTDKKDGISRAVTPKRRVPAGTRDLDLEDV